MYAVNKRVCEILMARKKWTPLYCTFCVNEKKRSECSNWQEAMDNNPVVEVFAEDSREAIHPRHSDDK